MEALNDIGASEFLGVQTMTVAVYTTWVTRTDLPGAAQIALSMLAIVVALLALERHRSEEHTSELQSLMRISYAVFCLKKKNQQKQHTHEPPQKHISPQQI